MMTSLLLGSDVIGRLGGEEEEDAIHVGDACEKFGENWMQFPLETVQHLIFVDQHRLVARKSTTILDLRKK